MIGKNLKKFREKCGLSINELSRRSGVNASYISAIERGEKNNPSNEILGKLGKVLKVDIKDFYEDINKVEQDYQHQTHLSSTYFDSLMKWSEDRFLKKYETSILRGHMAELFIRYKRLIEKFVYAQLDWRKAKDDFIKLYKQRQEPLSDVEIKELFLKQELEREIDDIISWIRNFPGWVARNEEEYFHQISKTGDSDIDSNTLLNAAHEIEGASQEDKDHDNNIMDDDNF